MTHQWHDTYHHRQTPAHHLDPRSKLFVGLLFIFAVLLSPHLNRIQLVGYPALLLLAVYLSGVRLKPLTRRFLSLLPFALLMVVSAWFTPISHAKLMDVLSKAACSIAAMTVLTLTTPFPDMLRALEQLRTPRLLVLFLGFLYRYGGVLYEEASQLERAWMSRYFGRLQLRQRFNLGHVLASLFLRSYERAERVFAAMQARGFSHGAGGLHLLHFTGGDAWFIGISGLLLGLIKWVPVR
jgi:cobalt/nickel transport system permease protein